MKATKARPEPQPDLIDASILVVDDEAMLRKVVGRGLTAAGCTVTYAADGEEALAKLAEAPPDLVISDVTMPRVDGFELLKRIREQTTTKALPVILLTGRGDTEDIVAGMGLGADDYLVKPFALRELLARVRAKIERPPVPASSLVPDVQAGVLSEAQFAVELDRSARAPAVAHAILIASGGRDRAPDGRPHHASSRTPRRARPGRPGTFHS